MFQIFDEPKDLTITEFIAILSLGYLLVSCAFNVGYFEQVPGHFVELFSLQDLFATNLPVLQYIFTVMFLYSITTLLTFWQLNRLLDWLATRLNQLSTTMFSDTLLEKLFMVMVVCIFYFLAAVIGISQTTSFSLLMLPYFLFHGFLVYVYVAAWRSNIVAYRTLLYVGLVNVVVFAYASGGNWVRSSVANASDLQSFQTKDGNCLDRKLMRSAGGGLLLYNNTMGQFEIRARDDFKAIFPSLGCI